ncbi:hypothetical protein OJF2_59730 [Aquisphaera giovannonii]|uniref:Uncharacterized protein n=1 Tax=Aquisphaera giovannonii TaxID=406548 RepID=A0A5B9WA02_9BACT|nr:hypothetical protein [Aquisphaera giovannonii]QEH37383.1 hypothetical protein OJF2_59730 [Aquisphaera giovannonii]
MSTISVVASIANAAACLAGAYGAVSRQARLVGCSRQAAYDHARKVLGAVRRLDPRGGDPRRLREELGRLRREVADLRGRLDRAIEVPLGKRREFAAVAAGMGLSLAHTREVLAFFLGEAAAPSRSALGRWAAAAGVAAGAALARLDALCRPLILAGCLDEIFFRGRPVLVAVEPASMTWFLGRRPGRLDGRTWAEALGEFPALRHVVADAGRALQAGIATVRELRAAGGGAALDSTLDVFHTVHRAREALGPARHRERRAAEAYEAADRKVEKARRRGVPAQAAAGEAKSAWRKVEAAIGRAEAMEATWGLLSEALEVFRPDGRLNDRAWAEARVAEHLPELAGKEWDGVANHLEGPTSFTFLDRLHADLEALPIAAGLREALVRLWWLRRRRPRGTGPAAGAGHVAHLVQRVYCSKLDDDWAKWYAAVSAILRGVVRASSSVECMNSVLRMHQSRHRTITPGMLDLKRLYWNTRRFRGGKRKGECPYEHLGLVLPTYDFWALIEDDFAIALAEAKAVAARKARARLIARATAA